MVLGAVLAAVLVAGGLSLRGANAPLRQWILPPAQEIQPRSVILHLSLSSEEVPSDYALIRDAAFLASMGMTENPDYIGNLSQLEAVAARGGLNSFLAVYGRLSEPRLMLNGVFFRKGKHFEQFVAFQQKKKRPVVMLRKAQPDGAWLFIVARDGAASYGEAEQGQIATVLARYQQRIGAERLSEAMWTNP